MEPVFRAFFWDRFSSFFSFFDTRILGFDAGICMSLVECNMMLIANKCNVSNEYDC